MKKTVVFAALIALIVPMAARAADSTTDAAAQKSVTAGTPTTSQSAPLAAASYAFTPPDGWTKRDATMNMGGVSVVGMWMSPLYLKTGENLNVGMQPAPNATLDQVANVTRKALEKVVGATNITQFKAEKVCNGTQDGWFIATNMAFGAQHMSIEQTMALNNGAAYVATYTRLSEAAENQDARKALDSLCAK